MSSIGHYQQFNCWGGNPPSTPGAQQQHCWSWIYIVDINIVPRRYSSICQHQGIGRRSVDFFSDKYILHTFSKNINFLFSIINNQII